MGIANIINTAGGGGGGGSEIITNLVNSVDGAGLRLANQGYISCADVSANRFGTNDFSVEFVLSQETNAINADIFISNLNGSNQAVDAAVIRWDVIQNDNIQLVFTNSSATETAYNFGYDPAPDLNEPTHYLVSADRSGNAVLYRNGAEIASVSIAASSAANVGNSGQPTVIGSPVNNFGVTGNVYRFRTYSKALSSDEAKNVFDRADVPTALVSNLLLDLDCAYANPTQSTVIQDRGPNNQDGTLNGTITQTNVIKQLNSTSARIGTPAATAADGELLVSGNVGVGDTTPTSPGGAARFVEISGTSASLVLTDSDAATWEWISAGGNLKAAKDGSDYLSIDSSGNVNVDGGGYVKIGPADTQADLRLYRDDATINTSGIAIGDINFGGADADNDNAARLRVKSDGAWTASSSPTAFEFQTCPSGSESPQTRLIIASDGNVGVGCDPSYPLEVQSGGVGTVLRAGTDFVSIDSTGTEAEPTLILNGDANTGLWHPAADTLAVSTGGAERMRINSTGQVTVNESVAIGTTPTAGISLNVRENSTTTAADIRNANASGFGLYVAGGSSSSQYAFRAADKDNTALFTVKGDGLAEFANDVAFDDHARVYHGNLPNTGPGYSSHDKYNFNFTFSGTYGVALITLDIAAGIGEVAAGRYTLAVSCTANSGVTTQLMGSVTEVFLHNLSALTFADSGSSNRTFTLSVERTVTAENWGPNANYKLEVTNNHQTLTLNSVTAST